MVDSTGKSVSIPLRWLAQEPAITKFTSLAEVRFDPAGGSEVHYQNFVFQDGTLSVSPVTSSFKAVSDLVYEKPVPVFSIAAVVIFILFRNIFYGAFQRYFLNFQSNYEVDFNIQKIGVVPVILAFLVVIFSFSEFYYESPLLLILDSGWQIQKLKDGLLLLIKPLGLSVTLFFILNLTTRLFPIVFSDLKTLFSLSLLVLVWNFANFGAELHHYVSYQNFAAIVCGIYFVVRTILLFNVLRRTYRFHLPITLFYICAFNLGTALILTDGLLLDILSLYE